MSTNQNNITFHNLKYNEGDDRSYGKISFKANTPIGELIISGQVATDASIEDMIATLNGEEVDGPDLEVPHFYAGDRSVSNFEDNKEKFLSEDINKWINSRK